MHQERDEQRIVSDFLASTRTGGPLVQRSAAGYDPPHLVHGVPRSKIRFDGVESPGHAVQKFDGQPLYYVLDEQSAANEDVAVYSHLEDALKDTGVRFLDDLEAGGDVSAHMAAPQLFGYLTLFEHINYAGAAWNFYPSWGPISDFGHVYPTWWWTTNINEKVSSVDVNVKADLPSAIAWVILYRDLNFHGDVLLISDSYSYDDRGGGMIRDLRSFGWNDAASSMRYGYSL